MTSRIILASLSLFALSSAACAAHTTKDLVVARDEGKGLTQQYAGSCQQHWPRVRATVDRLGLETTETHEPDEILANYQKRGEIGGNLVGVFLEPSGDACRIRVVSLRRAEDDPHPNDWDTQFFDGYRTAISK